MPTLPSKKLLPESKAAAPSPDNGDNPKSFEESGVGRSLAWLADAPLFIDAEQVAGLYNAVAKPEHETAKIVVSLKKGSETAMGGKVGGEVEVGAASWLKTIFPFIDAKAKVSGEVSGSLKKGKEKVETVELRPVDMPQRQLVQLAIHYAFNLPQRMRIVYKPSETDPTRSGTWLAADFISEVPRGLVFLDFPERTKFVPTAAEVAGIGVQLIYPSVRDAFSAKSDEPAPVYPEPAQKKYHDKPDELATQRKRYWDFFDLNFSSTVAMEAVEKAVVGPTALVRWIDYRVPLGPKMPCIHLSLCAHGKYDTGTFAYRLIKRGFKHGLRIVGTMKSEPAVNVLAIFEK